MSTRETDPQKRAELHQARALLLAAESGIAMAKFAAQRGGQPEVERAIRAAETKLHEAMIGLVEVLAWRPPDE